MVMEQSEFSFVGVMGNWNVLVTAKSAVLFPSASPSVSSCFFPLLQSRCVVDSSRSQLSCVPSGQSRKDLLAFYSLMCKFDYKENFLVSLSYVGSLKSSGHNPQSLGL